MPLGGASVLLIYLLRMIAYERGRWIRERQTLISEHRIEIEYRDAELARREEECERHLKEWRDRYDSLRSDYVRATETLLSPNRGSDRASPSE